jgi:hypothetical protein
VPWNRERKEKNKKWREERKEQERRVREDFKHRVKASQMYREGGGGVGESRTCSVRIIEYDFKNSVEATPASAKSSGDRKSGTKSRLRGNVQSHQCCAF